MYRVYKFWINLHDMQMKQYAVVLNRYSDVLIQFMTWHDVGNKRQHASTQSDRSVDPEWHIVVITDVNHPTCNLRRPNVSHSCVWQWQTRIAALQDQKVCILEWSDYLAEVAIQVLCPEVIFYCIATKIGTYLRS